MGRAKRHLMVIRRRFGKVFIVAMLQDIKKGDIFVKKAGN